VNKLFMHVELELAHAIASWGISDGRLDIEDFSSSALKIVQFRRLIVLKHSRKRQMLQPGVVTQLSLRWT
jgi:hypothetical protein